MTTEEATIDFSVDRKSDDVSESVVMHEGNRSIQHKYGKVSGDGGGTSILVGCPLESKLNKDPSSVSTISTATRWNRVEA